MKEYIIPSLEILSIEVDDVILTSLKINESHNIGDGPFDLDM